MTPDEFQSKLTGITVEINRAVNHDLPLIVGNKAVDMFKQNFQEEGFFGGKWKDVKRRTNPPKRTRHPADARRKILTGRTANLGRSIRNKVQRGLAVIYSDAPYAPYHNEGTPRIPQRQFIGDHPKLRRMVQNEIERRLGRIFK